MALSRAASFIGALLAGGLVAPQAGMADASLSLSGPDLGRAVSGRQIYLSTPLGGEFPLNYRADGRVDGTGDAVGLGKFMQPKDSGRWWVAGNKLCQKWTSWYDGKVFCFTLQKAGEDRLSWRRDDGMSGTVRVGR
ncbi:MAG: hypothetical protein JWM36_1052 [Hyphomicrobiales bacterium]|nr:hypothetical protein [Hyphomicrobiales bacterium]